MDFKKRKTGTAIYALESLKMPMTNSFSFEDLDCLSLKIFKFVEHEEIENYVYYNLEKMIGKNYVNILFLEQCFYLDCFLTSKNSSLKKLNVGSLVDFGFLHNCRELEELTIKNAEGFNFNFVEQCYKITKLKFDYGFNASLVPVKNFPYLQEIYLGETFQQEIEPLFVCKELRKLCFGEYYSKRLSIGRIVIEFPNLRYLQLPRNYHKMLIEF